jgi:hypothetical protein
MPATALFSKTKRQKKHPRRTSKYMVAAAAAYQQALERKYGSLGPASAVRKIDPATGEVLATIPARTPEA